MGHPIVATWLLAAISATVVVTVPVVVVVVAVIFAIPMAFVEVPSVFIVIVVGMAPVGALIGRALPDSGHPDVSTAVDAPVAILPDVAVAGDGRAALITEGRGRLPDGDAEPDLGGGC